MKGRYKIDFQPSSGEPAFSLYGIFSQRFTSGPLRHSTPVNLVNYVLKLVFSPDEV